LKRISIKGAKAHNDGNDRDRIWECVACLILAAIPDQCRDCAALSRGPVRAGNRYYKTLLKACENFLRLSPPLIGMVRHDSRVKESIRHQNPILTRSPNTEAAEDVEKIARMVARELVETQRATAGF
jgi:hypothetical protein